MRRIMKRIGTALWVVLALVGGGVVALAAIAQFDTRQEDPNALLVKFVDFRPLYDAKKVLVVDVRDADSFAAGHIAGAMHVALPEISTRAEAVRAAARGRLVVTYCSCPSEGTSLAAAGRLMSAGVKAKALVGGYPRWVEFGGEVERGK
jgi:rhodanese-related sulfurtransferase